MIRRFLALSRLERVLLAQALILLPLVRWSLVAVGYRRTQTWLHLVSRFSLSPSLPLDPCGYVTVAQRLVTAAASSGLVAAPCLPRGLVLCVLLRRKGLDPALRFGVRRHNGRFEAHAWVETGYSPDDAARSGFAPLETPFT